MNNVLSVKDVEKILKNTPTDDDIQDLTEEEVSMIKGAKEEIALNFVYAYKFTTEEEVSNFLENCGCDLKDGSIEKDIELYLEDLNFIKK